MAKYAVSWKLAEDICDALGLDKMRVHRLKFEANADDMLKPLTIEVDYLPDYERLPAVHYDAIEIMIDPLAKESESDT